MEQFNPFSLVGKQILVTGASSGIGKGIAIACAKMGASVVISGRNEEKLKATLSEMPGNGHIIAKGDLTNQTCIDSIVGGLPKLDGVVHCAGIGHRKLTKMVEETDIEKVMSINYKAPVMLQTALMSQKKLNKGASIVFIASIAYNTPFTGNAIYSSSKGAIVSYAICLSHELANRLIRVNCISPAMVWTDLIMNEGDTVESLQEDEKTYPLKRYGQPEDIANLAIYLLSDASSWMTGNNIRITGGLRVN